MGSSSGQAAELPRRGDRLGMESFPQMLVIKATDLRLQDPRSPSVTFQRLRKRAGDQGRVAEEVKTLETLGQRACVVFRVRML